MSRCYFCDKCLCFGIKISHSHRRSNRMWKPNVRVAHIVINGAKKRIHACTRCIRSGKLSACC